MKNFNSIALFFVLAFISVQGFAQEPAQGGGNLLKDSRDNQEYKTVKIGETVWMAENLNFETEESWCYTRFNYDCRKYGRYYSWKAALAACPAGWRLPTDADFEQLFEDVGGEETAGEKLKSTTGWHNNGNGTDEFGFNVVPSGFRDYRGRFDRQTSYAYIWTATEDEGEKAVGVHLMSNRKDGKIYPYPKNFGIAVRCVKDK